MLNISHRRPRESLVLFTASLIGLAVPATQADSIHNNLGVTNQLATANNVQSDLVHRTAGVKHDIFPSLCFSDHKQTECAIRHKTGGEEAKKFEANIMGVNRGSSSTKNSGISSAFEIDNRGQIRIGDAFVRSGKDWLENIIGGTTSISQIATLSTSGTIGVLGGCRTSDNSQIGSQGCQGLSGFAINDNTTHTQTAYAKYSEARRYAGAGITQADEHDIVNLGSVVVATPTSMGPAGATIGDWSSCGRPDTPNNTNCSVGLGVINNGAAFEKAILIASNGLDTTLGGVSKGGIALEMANRQHVKWVNGSGGHASITSTGTAAETAIEQQFTDVDVRFINNINQPMFEIGVQDDFVNGVSLTPGTISNPPIIAPSGPDASIGLVLQSKGPTAPINLQSGAGSTTFYIVPTTNGVNYLEAVGAPTGSGPQLKASGADRNIDLRLSPQGLGRVINIGDMATRGHDLVDGASPLISHCGTSPTVSGSDNAGLVTTGLGATACTLTFAKSFSTRPYCTVTGENATVTYSVTSGAISITAGANMIIDYQCTGQIGG